MKFKSLNKIDDLLMDLDSVLHERGIDKIDIVLQFGVSQPRVKPTGNLAYGRMTDQYCPLDCGCRLNTDGKYFWCSSITCFYMGKRK